VEHEHRFFFDSVAPATVTSSLPLKDLIFRANRNWYFLPLQNFQQQVSIELARSTSILILPPAVYCCICPDVAYVYDIASCCSVFEWFTKIPFVCECLGRKIPFAGLKCERRNNLKPKHVYTFVCDKWKQKYILMLRFRSWGNSEDICIDKSKNLSNIMDIHLLDMQDKTKMGYIKFFLTMGYIQLTQQ
jgi:hypothetical protein